MAFDKHMNLVLGDCEEYRQIRSKTTTGSRTQIEEREVKRVLGLVLVRGENVVSLSVEGPPPPSDNERMTPGGPGVSRGAGRGGAIPVSDVQPGLTGPVRGVGGPGDNTMMPQMAIAAASGFAPRPPMPGNFGRPPPQIPGMGMAPGMGMGGPRPPMAIPGVPPRAPMMMPGRPMMNMPPRPPPGPRPM